MGIAWLPEKDLGLGETAQLSWLFNFLGFGDFGLMSCSGLLRLRLGSTVLRVWGFDSRLYQIVPACGVGGQRHREGMRQLSVRSSQRFGIRLCWQRPSSYLSYGKIVIESGCLG